MRNAVVIAATMLLLLTSCKKVARNESIMSTDRAPLVPVMNPAAETTAGGVSVATDFARPAASAAPPVAQPLAPSPRMIVRTASLSLIVTDATKAMQSLTAHAAQLGGYVTESKEWREADQLRGTITVRVPSARFDEMLVSAKKSAVRVQSESSSGTDVTQEFSDLGARLRNAEAAEVELRELLSTIRQRTQKAVEVLEVYAKLNEVRGEIEQLKGRMQYLSQVSAMSSITFELVPDVLAQPVVEAAWSPRVVAHNALRSLTESMQWIAELAIWFALYIAPIVLLLMIVVLPLLILLRRATTTSPAASESHPSHP